MTPTKDGALTKITHHDLVKKLAWEVAKNVIDHHKNVYPDIFKNAPSTFSVSIRNAIYNEIDSAIKCHTDMQIQEWIARSESHRKKMKRLKQIQSKASKACGNPEKIEEVLKELRNETR